MLNRLDAAIWTLDQPFRFFGLEIGARMTVLDLSGNGDLWIHSPVHLSASHLSALVELGTVAYIIAPNRWHHLYLTAFKAHFPKARYFSAPGLEAKRKDFAFDGILDNAVTYPWSKVLQHHLVQGIPQLNEVVFFHAPSRTLIVTDLGLHICEDQPFMTRVMFRMMGTYRKFGWTALEKRIFIKDAAAFQNSINSILAWDFDRIILAHGRTVPTQGKAVFQKAFLNSGDV